MKIAVAIEKGGTAKTSTAANIAFELFLIRELEAYTNPENRANGREPKPPNIILYDLDGQEDALSFADATVGTYATKKANARNLRGLVERDSPDIAIMDCPPALGAEVGAALKLADYAIVPVNSQFAALSGLKRLMETIDAARNSTDGNPHLRMKILLTMFDTRAGHCHDVETAVRQSFGADVFKTVIPHSYVVADASMGGELTEEERERGEHKAKGVPLGIYAPDSKPARAYQALAREVLALAKPAPNLSATRSGATTVKKSRIINRKASK